ncbi:armadillo-type protein [Lentinula raphanica]|uniref:Armadillo-type protein n=1 Tax=Lentinula raphanica TaxID=153919 RepID=A0AA38PGG3_9AGAR|nr:armadillo-type protein [Lentinula raphanica]
MNFVPYSSSGASSRRHYVLVRKVETASSTQAVDDVINAEVEYIVQEFTKANVATSLCKQYLIILLYCITVSNTPLTALESVLPHALNLAEAGKNISEKRLGYLFCAELMTEGHELQLMLVNTLRKHLDSPHPANISLALNHLIQCPFVDVIPAIQNRLQELLAHNSPQIRRRTLLALRALSKFDSELLSKPEEVILDKIKDPDDTVCNAALITASKLCQSFEARAAQLMIQKQLSDFLHDTANLNRRGVVIRTLETLRTLGFIESNLPLLNELIRRGAHRKDNVLLRSAFLCLHPFPAQAISAVLGTGSPVIHVRHLLTSRQPNEQYLFLTCLECVDPQSWAGTTPDTPTVLEQWEVEQIMGYLHSRDPVLRKKTVNVINQVDPSIVLTYYENALQNLSDQPTNGKAEHALPLFEVLEIQSGVDGERYARHVLELLGQIEAPSSPDDNIFEGIVDIVLTHIRYSSDEFRRVASGCLLSSLTDSQVRIGSTAMVILAALACENSGQLSLSWVEILEGISSRIAFYPISVQDASLLSLLRIAADCPEIPRQVLDTIFKLKEASKRHIRRRCEQFMQLSSDKERLLEIVNHARSSTLPDFLDALQTYRSNDNTHGSLPHSSSPRGFQNLSPSPNLGSLSASKLRYAAYDAPVPTPRLQRRQISNSNFSSEHSTLGSPHSLATPLAGGELALVASTTEFESEMSATIGDKLSKMTLITEPNDAASRNDLIAFDSPFVAEPPDSSLMSVDVGSPASQLEFDALWESHGTEVRGWYEHSIERLLRQLRLMDASNVEVSVIEASSPPYPGETKVLLRSKPHATPASCAVLRIKESEEDGSLWKLRGNMPLHATVRNFLTEDAGQWV